MNRYIISLLNQQKYFASDHSYRKYVILPNNVMTSVGPLVSMSLAVASPCFERHEIQGWTDQHRWSYFTWRNK